MRIQNYLVIYLLVKYNKALKDNAICLEQLFVWGKLRVLLKDKDFAVQWRGRRTTWLISKLFLKKGIRYRKRLWQLWIKNRSRWWLPKIIATILNVGSIRLKFQW